MKAKELLKWIVNNDVCTDSMGTVEVDEEFDFKGYFGYEPAVAKVPEGEYLYFYGDQVMTDDVELLTASTGEAPYRIPTKEKDEKNGGNLIIYLIKIDELK